MGYLQSGLKRKAAVLAVAGVMCASATVLVKLDEEAIKPSKTLPPEKTTVEEKKSVQVAKDMGDTVVTETVTQTQTTTVTTISVVREEIEETDGTEDIGYEEVELADAEEAEEPSYEARGVVEITFEPPAETAQKVVSETAEYAEEPEEEEYAETTTTTTAAYYDSDEEKGVVIEKPEQEEPAVTTTEQTLPPETTTTTAAPVVTTTAAPTTTAAAATTTAAPKPVTTTTTTTAKTPAKDNGLTAESRLNNAVLNPDYCLTGEDDKLVRTYLAKITNSTMTNYEKAAAVYDYLIKNTYYSYGGWSEPYKSVLVNGFGTCTEYSRVLAAMLRYMGFNARTVDGYTAMAAGGYGYHMWTEVIINGQIYVMDANVDDDMSYGTYISHARFCKTYEEVAGNYIKN